MNAWRTLFLRNRYLLVLSIVVSLGAGLFAFQQLRSRPRITSTSRLAMGGEHGGDGVDARQRPHRALAGNAQGLPGGAVADIDLDREAHVGAVDLEARDHVEAHHVGAPIEIGDRGKRLENPFAAKLCHSFSSRFAAAVAGSARVPLTRWLSCPCSGSSPR